MSEISEGNSDEVKTSGGQHSAISHNFMQKKTLSPYFMSIHYVPPTSLPTTFPIRCIIHNFHQPLSQNWTCFMEKILKCKTSYNDWEVLMVCSVLDIKGLIANESFPMTLHTSFFLMWIYSASLDLIFRTDVAFMGGIWYVHHVNTRGNVSWWVKHCSPSAATPAIGKSSLLSLSFPHITMWQVYSAKWHWLLPCHNVGARGSELSSKSQWFAFCIICIQHHSRYLIH